MELLLVFSFVLFGLGSFAQELWRARESVKYINNPYTDNKTAAQKGQALYSKLFWACHCKNGNGDGPTANNLKPKPNDFSPTGIRKQTDGELFWKLSNGKETIVPYKNFLNEEKRWQLINYNNI